ncbi:hypothetical protein [Halorubrum sp. CSM-61]|uniref:DUF7117 family protein n=1 Tax=Halorubrum sp. CSM-61 TaxID=2485838 RepID=UPI000F4B4B11|nr:hypothetical protein [Halorubrum sp. CSM-61]
MKVRGERECQECGARWSYYETGSVECPDCGALRSVGVDDRTAHTDAPATLDLTPHRARFGDARGTLPEEGVDDLKADLREYARKRGFIRGGELLPLDDAYLAARELLEAVDLYDRLRDPTDRDREYLLALLAGAADGDRPATEAVPDSLREARGMAAVRAVDEYRSDLLAFLDELSEAESGEQGDADASAPTVSVAGDDPHARIDPTRELLERLRDRVKRVEALTGDVPPADADALADAAGELGEYVRTGDETALDRARDLLSDSES